MVYEMVKWSALVICGAVLFGSTTSMDVNPIIALAEVNQPSLPLLSHTLVPEEEVAKRLPKGAPQVGENGSKEFESSVVNQSANKAFLMANENADTVCGEKKGDRGDLREEDMILQINQVIEMRIRLRVVRHPKEAVVEDQKVYQKIEKALQDIKKLFWMAHRYIGRWEIYFQDEYEWNELALLRTIRAGIKENAADPCTTPEVRSLAQTALCLLDHLQKDTFGYDEALKLSEMMETTLSETTCRDSLKLPFIQKAPQFLRALSHLEPYSQKKTRYEAGKICLSLTNKWVRKLQTYASRDIKEDVLPSRAMASLKIIAQDAQFPEWIQCEARIAVNHLDSLKKYLDSQNQQPPSILKAIRRLSIDFPVPGNLRTLSKAFKEYATLADDLLTPHAMNQEDQLLLLRPERLRSWNEQKLMNYIERACLKKGGAEPIMLAMKKMAELTTALEIRKEFHELHGIMFDPYRPTIWLVLFGWIAKNAQKNEAYRETLSDIEVTIIQIVKIHLNCTNVQRFSEAVDELIFEAMFSPPINALHSQTHTLQEGVFLGLNTPLKEHTRNPEESSTLLVQEKQTINSKMKSIINSHTFTSKTSSEATSTTAVSYDLPIRSVSDPEAFRKGKRISEDPGLDLDSPESSDAKKQGRRRNYKENGE